MKQVLLIIAVFAAAYFGFRVAHRETQHETLGQPGAFVPPVPANPTPSLSAKSTPAPAVTATNATTPVPSLQDPLGKLWNESEWGGEWRGVWTRRGLSPFFDAVLHRGNQTKTFFAGVTVRGRSVHVVTQNSTDGRNCIYDGSIAEDGKTISGTYGFGDGTVNPWSATIQPLDPIVHVPAPAGLFFLVQAKSLTTDEGIDGLRAGTPVALIEDRGDTLLVKTGAYQLEVMRSELTDDVTVAQYLIDTERSTQQFIRQRGQAEARAMEEARKVQEGLLAHQRSRDIAAMTTGSRGWSNSLNRGAYNQTEPKRSSNGTGFDAYDSQLARDQSRVQSQLNSDRYVVRNYGKGVFSSDSRSKIEARVQSLEESQKLLDGLRRAHLMNMEFEK